MDRAIRWSPSSSPTNQRFLLADVAGQQFRLCNVTSVHPTTKSLTYDVLSTHIKVPSFRAFDWSPLDESLVAVGQSSGDATILRIPEGEAESKEVYNFPAKTQRYCNAVAFSSHGLLAAGLDRVRNDQCLHIWDVHSRLSTRAGRGYHVEPLRKLGSEPITSVKFFRDQPEVLVVGVKGPQQQLVRIVDLREQPQTTFLQFSTSCVHNLAIDWLDENYIASGPSGMDSTVCIWDRRVGARLSAATPGFETNGQSEPAIQFDGVKSDKASIWSLRFSKTKRGCLGVLSSNGHFKAYNVAKEYVAEEFRSPMDRTLGENSISTYPEPIYTKAVCDILSPFDHPSRGCKESERVVSFDFLNISNEHEPSAVTLAADNQIKIVSVKPPAPQVRLSSQGMLVCGKPDEASDFKSLRPLGTRGSSIGQLAKVLRESTLQRQDKLKATNKKDIAQDKPAHLSSREERERLLFAGVPGRMTVKEALTLLTVNMRRCKEGYLFNETRNKQILADDPSLQEFWDWIERARSDSTDDSMIMNQLDLNYLGVFDVWTGDLGPSLEARWLGSTSSHYPDINDTIADLVQEKLKLPAMENIQTRFSEQRRLGLRICGAAQSHAELEDLVKALAAQNQHTKAAALAVFQGEPKLAYLALRSNNPTQAHKLLAMAIAGATKGKTDPDWQETCAEIAKELTDPYGRAIIALVSKGDWHSVIAESTLPLRYRVEVALRRLPDDDLTTYLTEATKRAIHHGNIEGIVLTGLGHSAMDLFQSYINKFADVQTPVLAMSHTVPRFITTQPNKHRFEQWRENYRVQINSWKLQLDRARFDVGSRKFASTWDGRRLVEPPRQQVSLTCNYCAKPLTQHDSSNSNSLSMSASAGTVGSEIVHSTPGNPLGTAAMSGTICPKCGRHMPRCGVCTLYLGSADPMSKACVAAESGTGSGNEQVKVSEAEIMRRFIVFCINCSHGFHAHHAREWFSRHKVCPVADCSCICDR
ncbi:uncharacterized protein BDV14DRAFT_109822 [Aspergillus stella-maris]|uniref:uncharacterized protein n=1 Tax=Aspergillus stella-maris TaxID=1810926 RepID=UPI003CCD6C40